MNTKYYICNFHLLWAIFVTENTDIWRVVTKSPYPSSLYQWVTSTNCTFYIIFHTTGAFTVIQNKLLSHYSHGQHLVLLFSEEFVNIRHSLPLDLSTNITNGTWWTAVAKIPMEYFPPNVSTGGIASLPKHEQVNFWLWVRWFGNIIQAIINIVQLLFRYNAIVSSHWRPLSYFFLYVSSIVKRFSSSKIIYCVKFSTIMFDAIIATRAVSGY